MHSYRNSDPRPPIMQGTPPPPEWRVPREDWDRAPWNRWSFQNVSALMPTARVKRAKEVLPLTRDLRDIGRIEFKAVDGSRMTVDRLLDETYTDGFLVHQGGRVIHESYHNGMRPATLHLAQSVSKSIVATVAGILIGKGKLNPAAPITAYLPELEATAWSGATLQQVMDMTSGVKYSEAYTDPASDIGRTDVAAGWKLKPQGADPALWPSAIWDQILGLHERDADHGVRFDYRSIETDVMAHAMERVTGERLPKLVSTLFWERIGTEQNARFTVDSAGYGLAQGGFNACLRDFARVGLVHLNGGRAGGEQVVPASWVQDIRSGPHGLFDDYGREVTPNGLYRNQFWIEDVSRETVMCQGVFGQLIYIAPEYDMVAVKLSSWPDFLNNSFKANTLRAMHAIGRAGL